MSEPPALVGQNYESQTIPQRPRVAGIMVPKVGDEVYVFSEPVQGQAPYVYKGTITEYPLRNGDQVDWSFLHLLIEEIIQPSAKNGMIPFVHRARLGKILTFNRKFMRYFSKPQANQYSPIPDIQYESYIQQLSEEADPSSNEDPQGGGKRKKRKSRSHKALHRKRAKQSQKRRRA